MMLSRNKIITLIILIMGYLIAPIILCAKIPAETIDFRKKDSLQIESLQKTAANLFMIDNSKCVEKLTEALTISQRNNNTLKIIELNYSIGKVYDYLNQFELARNYYNKACEIAFSMDNSSYFSSISKNFDILSFQKGMSKESFERYIKSIKVNQNNLISFIYIGNIYYDLKNKNKAEQYYLKAYEMMQTDSSEASLNAYLELGKVFLNQSEYKRSQRMLDEGIRIAQKRNSLDKELQFKYYLAIINDSLGNKIQALTSLQQISDQAIKEKNRQIALLSLFSLATIYNEVKKSDKNIKSNIESFLLSDSLDFITSKRDLIKKISEFYEKQGDYKNALEHHKQLEKLNDSLYSIEKYRVTSELIFKNETSTQEKENLILQYKLDYNKKLFLYAAVFMTIFLILLIIEFLLFLKIRRLNFDLLDQIAIVKRKTEELEAVNQRQNRTFSIIGHDLRAQISSIISFFDYLEVVQFDSFEPEQLKMAESTQRDALNVLDLLENLLSWGKAQSQNNIVTENTFSIKVIMEKVEEYIRHRAEQKNVNLITNADFTGVCYGDSNMIYTVFRNLIANSLKFTPSGGQITLSSRKENDFVIFEISDTGIGMSPDVIQKIFYKRESYTSHGTNNEIGSGLGLGVCIDFIEQHRSKLIVKSEVGKGTTMSFFLRV